jgi:uncharacterized protein (TIGR03086 family)
VAEYCNTILSASSDPLVTVLGRAFDAVGVLVSNVGADQWSAPTPCAEWSVRRLVEHLIGMNRVFTALLAEAPLPRRAADQVEEDPVTAYRETSAALLRAFGQCGALDRQYQGPLGTASGAERLQIRLYDLLAHGWDLAQATGQPVDLPDDLVESSVAFARVQLAEQSRDGRFAPPQNVDENASAIERLVAFLGRSVAPPP